MIKNPARPAAGTVVCRLAELTDPGAHGVMFTTPEASFHGLVVRQGEAVFGYEDLCPHAGWRLAPFDEAYLTRDGKRLQCLGHGAMFRLQDGLCEVGPCQGESLTPWPVELRGDEIIAV